jgi:hypothetical protein
MGWLYQSDPVDDPVAHLIRKFTYEDDTRALQPLKGARVGNTVYLAVRSTDKSTGRAFVFAGVILISNTKKHGLGHMPTVLFGAVPPQSGGASSATAASRAWLSLVWLATSLFSSL